VCSSDLANHAQDGLLIMTGPGVEGGERQGMHLLDVAPTVLDLLGLDTPDEMRGSSLMQKNTPAESVCSTVNS